jgi:hypothetical protein
LRAAFVATLLLAVGCAQAGVAPARRDWSQPVDFAQLRAEFAARRDFAERCPGSAGILFDSMQRKDMGGVVKLTDAILAACPIDIDAHYLRAIALRNLGFVDEAEQHIAWYSGLLDTVLASGDGKTKASPYLVVSVAEEYAVLRALRLELKSQTLEDRVEALAVVDEDGHESTVYFAREGSPAAQASTPPQ